MEYLGSPGYNLDHQVRLSAFEFLSRQTQIHGDVLPRALLQTGFNFGETRVPLLGPQGIFKPKLIDLPLSISTVPIVSGVPRPYEDEVDSQGLLTYHYRREGPDHRDNVGLRQLLALKEPLIYLFGTIPGRYKPAWPAFIVADNRNAQTFTVAIDDAKSIVPGQTVFQHSELLARRQYVTTTVRQRLHQQVFRERVLDAYQDSCAICSLRHKELLDAAHILPDNHPKGEPIIPNGISLCKLHHAAYDKNVLGIRPDLVIEIRSDILKEIDGPMLKHGIQHFEGALVQVPRPKELRPNPDFLQERYDGFRAA